MQECIYFSLSIGSAVGCSYLINIRSFNQSTTTKAIMIVRTIVRIRIEFKLVKKLSDFIRKRAA